MLRIRTDQELINRRIKKINQNYQNYQSKSNNCVEAENDRRITGLAEQAPRPSALSAHDRR